MLAANGIARIRNRCCGGGRDARARAAGGGTVPETGFARALPYRDKDQLRVALPRRPR